MWNAIKSFIQKNALLFCFLSFWFGSYSKSCEYRNIQRGVNATLGFVSSGFEKLGDYVDKKGRKDRRGRKTKW